MEPFVLRGFYRRLKTPRDVSATREDRDGTWVTLAH